MIDIKSKRRSQKDNIKVYVYFMVCTWYTYGWYMNIRIGLFIASMDHVLVVYIE